MQDGKRVYLTKVSSRGIPKNLEKDVMEHVQCVEHVENINVKAR